MCTDRLEILHFVRCESGSTVLPEPCMVRGISAGKKRGIFLAAGASGNSIYRKNVW